MSEFNDFWYSLEEKINNIDNSIFFRGQSDYSWSILSTFHRYMYVDMQVNKLDLNVLYKLITQFEVNLSKLSIKPFKNKTSIHSWFKYARHYGLPVPCIDLTKSFYIALYFACCENFESDGAIYLVNIKDMLREYAEKMISTKFFSTYNEYNGIIFSNLLELPLNKKIQIPEIKNFDLFYQNEIINQLKLLLEKENLSKILMKKSVFTQLLNVHKKLISIINQYSKQNNSYIGWDIVEKTLSKTPPIFYYDLFFNNMLDTINKRALIQQGVFIYDTIDYKQLNKKGWDDFFSDKSIEKIRIPKEYKKLILEKLNLMNINATVLYMNENGAVIDAQKNISQNIELFDSTIDFYK